MGDGTWVKTVYGNDADLVPKEAEAFTISFKNDGTFSATTDCNSMSGSYEANNEQLSFGEAATTLMFCEDSQEQEFSKLLSEVQAYFFTNKGELILDLEIDTGSMIFR